MITVRNINGKPERIPANHHGSHVDTDFFYFFETKQEAEAFRQQLADAAASLPPEEKEKTQEEINADFEKRIKLLEDKK